MWQEIRRDHTDTVRPDNEPYFEDEILTELYVAKPKILCISLTCRRGYSLENHVCSNTSISRIAANTNDKIFGGIGLSFIQSGRLPSHGVPQAGMFL